MAVKVETERKAGSQVVVSVEVPEDQVASSIERAYARLAPRVRIAGFRPGKAPRPMVEREIGWQAIRQEAIDLLLPTAYDAALNETGLDPIDLPRVEVQQFDRGLPFRFKATLSVKPEVTLNNYRDIRVPRPSTEVTDREVDNALERLRLRFAELESVERPVQKGDFLTVDIHILRGAAVLVGESQRDAQLEVNPERLLPGLAEGLIGQAVGQTCDIPLTLPADYPNVDLAGANVTFRVTVKSIKEKNLPALDDELAKQVGRGQTLQDLRQEIRDDLEDASIQAAQQRFENEVLKALSDRVQVELPDTLIDREITRQIRDLELRLQEQGIRLDRYLEYTNNSLDVLRAERRPQATQKVRIELALEAVAEREGLTVSDSEVEDAVKKALSEDTQLTRKAEELKSADPVRAYFRHQLLIRKTVDYLCALAAQESSDTMGSPSPATSQAQIESAGTRGKRKDGKAKG